LKFYAVHEAIVMAHARRGCERSALMVRSERIRTLMLIGLAAVFILLVIGLAISWLTGHEAHRSEVIMVLGGVLLCASLLWIRYTRKPPP
jgi:uncharacterized membrane protein